MAAIGRIWANRIEAGTQKYNKCPAKYQPYVLDAMKEDVEKHKMSSFGEMTPELFEELTGVPYSDIY